MELASHVSRERAMSVRSVAVIGLGAMGGPMATRIQAAGFELTVCDTREEAVVPFAGGGRVARTPAECAASDLAIVIVATSVQVREVLLGVRGLLSGLQPGRAPLVALMGTMSPESVREFALTLRESGVRSLDAPVCGGTTGAQEGTLAILVGGAPEDAAIARPVFDCLAAHVHHLGDIGTAQTLKILNNIISIVNSFLSAETFRIALEYGLDLVQVAHVLETGTGRNWLTRSETGPAAVYAAMLRAQSFDAGLKIIRKDLELARALAERVNGKYPLLDGIEALLGEVGAETLETWKRITESLPQH